MLGYFLKVKAKKGGNYLGLLKFQIFFGVLGIPDIFLGEQYMLGPSLRTKKNESTPPPGPLPLPLLNSSIQHGHVAMCPAALADCLQCLSSNFPVYSQVHNHQVCTGGFKDI